MFKGLMHDFRCSFKLTEREFTSMSFIVDTGSSGMFYLSKKARDALRQRILINETDSEVIIVDGMLCQF